MAYITKQMIVELIDYMKENGKKKLLVEDYIKQTQNVKNWTTQRKITLYKAVHETKALYKDYCPIKREEKETPELYIRVSLIG
ncbi:hypothetical protein [Enterococcus faecalis]|uniref:hypothetical protein n=1 Tax=Enterococcus faecalis TaxID=1351 RepID=UPI001AD77BB5|nr:hypothetical protein [Enterococcus faecalis]MBO6338635.1 hypothetical protein [Enterococcus faecalis]MBO6365079.1 hypothetical protein [Enterococcus faecalis]